MHLKHSAVEKCYEARKIHILILEELKIREILLIKCRQDDQEKLIVPGKIEGKRHRGRFPWRWLDEIKNITAQSIQTSLREAMENSGLSMHINHNVTILQP